MSELRERVDVDRAMPDEGSGLARSTAPALVGFGLLLGVLAVALLQWHTARFLGSELAGFVEDGLAVAVEAPVAER